MAVKKKKQTNGFREEQSHVNCAAPVLPPGDQSIKGERWNGGSLPLEDGSLKPFQVLTIKLSLANSDDDDGHGEFSCLSGTERQT